MILPPSQPAKSSTVSGRRPAPTPPMSLHGAGLSRDFVAELLLRVLDRHRTRSGLELAEDVALAYPLIADILDELRARAWTRIDRVDGAAGPGYRYRLTERGRIRARESAARTGWIGPAPVPLHDFVRRVRAQSMRGLPVPRERLVQMLDELTLPEGLIDRIGPALVSGHSLFLYGAPGNGKTAIAERLAEIHDDPIHLPHAVIAQGEVIAVFDPSLHRPVGPTDDPSCHQDPRWVEVQRPSVLVGGELTADDLELRFDPQMRVHRAPLQVRALGGVLIMDDFGRQQVTPRDLLNRWIVPLERHIDHLTLANGHRFGMPFDTLLVFASNDDPEGLVDEALYRRIRYKIHLDSPDARSWREILRRESERRTFELPDGFADYVFREFYTPGDIEPRGCHPRDLIEVMQDLLEFRGLASGDTPVPDAMLERLSRDACLNYFGRRAGSGLLSESSGASPGPGRAEVRS